MIEKKPGSREYRVTEDDFHLTVYAGPDGSKRFVYVTRGSETEAYYRVGRCAGGCRVEVRHPRSPDFPPTQTYRKVSEVLAQIRVAHKKPSEAR